MPWEFISLPFSPQLWLFSISTNAPSSTLPSHVILSNLSLLQIFPLAPTQLSACQDQSPLDISDPRSLYTLVITTPSILIAIEGLPSYQADITCQLLVQLLHHITLTQIQHFRACPDNLPNVFGLPLHTTLSLLLGPVLKLLHTHSFYHCLEELPSNVLYLAFCQVYLYLTWAEQQHYHETWIAQPPTHSSTPIPLALWILSCPTFPAPSAINKEDVIQIQVAEGQWITFSASRVLIHNFLPSIANTHCYISLHLFFLSTDSPRPHCSSLLGNTMWSL